MSITINKQPQYISPAYNPVVFEVTSDEQTREDFKYVCQVFDELGTLLGTLEKFGGTSVDDIISFDISVILKRNHKFDFWRYYVTGSEYIYKVSNYKIPYSVEIFEYYDGDLQDSEYVETLATLPVSLSTIRFSYFDYEDEIKNDFGKWLTNFDSIRVRPKDKLTVSFLNGVEGCGTFTYSFYNGSTLLSSVIKNNPFGLPAGAEDVYHLHAGLYDISAFCSVSDTIRDTTTRYIIKQNSTKTLEFNVVAEDCRFDGVRIHYLNEWGAVDSFLFSLATRRGVKIEKKKAKLPFTNTPLRPSVFGLGTSPYVVKYTDRLKLTSDYISENDNTALLEMFSSPLVSVETEQKLFVPNATRGNKIILPADIELTDYEIKQAALDRLFNLELEVNISVDNTRQSL